MISNDVATETVEDLYENDAPDPHFEDAVSPQEPSEYPANERRINEPRTRHDDESEEENDELVGNVKYRRQRAQERLVELRREQESAQQDAHELDVLDRKQREFTEGKRDLSTRIGTACGRLSRDVREGERRIELASAANDALRDHLLAIESLNPEQWDDTDLHRELNHSLGILEEARAEYERQDARLTPLGLALGSSSLSGGNILPANQQGLPNFKTLFLAGLYFSLPIAFVAFLITAAILWKLA